MKRFAAVQHSYSEFLGTVEKQLENRGIGFTYFRPFTGQSVPGSALQYDALWLLGGAWPVTDLEHCPWIEDELRLALSKAGVMPPPIHSVRRHGGVLPSLAEIVERVRGLTEVSHG